METCAGILDVEIAVSVDRDNLVQIIHDAWICASDGVEDEVDKQKQNSCRSRKWVDKLAWGFRAAYDREYTDTTRENPYRVFWGKNGDNKKHFRRNEFLFDVMVCSVSTVESLQHKSNCLEFIYRCHWQVESELNRKDSREVVIDMCKLVSGSAENKLFVAAHRKTKHKELRGICGSIASRCQGKVYLAFVAHPEDWATKRDAGGEQLNDPKVYEWLAGDWVPLGIER